MWWHGFTLFEALSATYTQEYLKSGIPITIYTLPPIRYRRAGWKRTQLVGLASLEMDRVSLFWSSRCCWPHPGFSITGSSFIALENLNWSPQIRSPAPLPYMRWKSQHWYWQEYEGLWGNHSTLCSDCLRISSSCIFILVSYLQLQEIFFILFEAHSFTLTHFLSTLMSRNFLHQWSSLYTQTYSSLQTEPLLSVLNIFWSLPILKK